MKPKALHIVEEVFNSVIHGLGAICTLVGIGIFIARFAKSKTIIASFGFSLFLATLLIMLLISTLYHSLIFTKARKVFLVLDYSAIFLFIAGTYTAFITAIMPNIFGIICMIAIWAITITAIVFRAIFHQKDSPRFVLVYLLLGWFAVVLIKIAWGKIPLNIALLLIAGGLCYSAGTIFFAYKRLPFSHTLWHIFVLCGVICHYLALANI